MGYRWKPNATQKARYHAKMVELEAFLEEHPEIDSSLSMNSFYFTIDGQSYRVSNHTVEASNAMAYDDYGNMRRGEYHPGGREDDVIYIHASKTRLVEIYNDLLAGYTLDGRGKRKTA